MISSLKSALIAASIILVGVQPAVVAPSACAADSGPKNIVDTLTAAGNFTTLLKALQEAGLEKSLKEKGPITLFAPDDVAFAKLPSPGLNDILSSKPRLLNLLKYHVVKAKVVSREADRYGTVKSLEGDELTISGNPKAMQVESANVVKADIPCSNGYIQEIDQVLLPSDRQQ